MLHCRAPQQGARTESRLGCSSAAWLEIAVDKLWRFWTSAAEVETLDVRVGEQRLARALKAVAAELQHVASIGHRQRLGGVLLYHQHRIPGALHLDQLFEDERYELGR